MRGKADQRQGREPPGRITPAYAGKSSYSFGLPSHALDHPRVCGEKSACCLRMSSARGSPPRMRGKVLRRYRLWARLRITPAYAGKSQCAYKPAQQARDHPRVCGEKQPVENKQSRRGGSPPRMRGKEACSACVHFRYGITPAYAGKRQERSLCRTNRRDHPRVCGEKSISTTSTAQTAGSPPRMRGKEVPENTYQLKHRITPAYAGKRFCVRWNIGNFRDHPRVCGEKMYGLLGASFALGSPPRMRGKGRVLPVFDSLTGITPAYAGKSVYFAIFCDFVEDHPRVCGEKQNAPIMQGLNLGSPPRMRGKD